MSPFSPPIKTTLVILGAAALSACAASGASAPAPSPIAAAAPVDIDAGDASIYGLYLAGEAAIDRGSSRDAAFYFAKASALDPSSQSIRSRAFTAALVAGEVNDAARIAAGLTDGTEPVAGLARLTRGVEDIADNKGQEGLVLLTAPVPAPHAGAAALLRPWAALEAGDQTVAEALPAVAENPVLATVAALGRAEILEREGRFDEAEKIFKSRASTKNALFILKYGAFLERRGRAPEALSLYQKAVAAKPEDLALADARARVMHHQAPPAQPTVREAAAEALIAPAVLMLAQHQGDSGLAYLRLALRLDPKLDEAWVLVGDAMTNAGDPQAAQEAYSRVRAGSDQFGVARGDLALALQKAGDKEGALTLIRQTMAEDPKDPRLLTLYADLLSDDERYDEATAALTQAIGAVGEANAGWSLFYLRGAAEERAGRWPAAEADLKKALSLNPTEPEVMNYLGYAWVDRGEHLPEALALLEKAEAKQPDSGAIVDSLGWARYRTHDYASAIIDLERAVQLDPADPEVNNHLGDVYWRVGRRLEAQYQWRWVLTLDPDAKMRADVETKLTKGLPAEPRERIAEEGPPPTLPGQP